MARSGFGTHFRYHVGGIVFSLVLLVRDACLRLNHHVSTFFVILLPFNQRVSNRLRATDQKQLDGEWHQLQI